MGLCLVLFVSAGTFVRQWSVPVALVMCVVAAALPPVAVITANRQDRADGPPDGR